MAYGWKLPTLRTGPSDAAAGGAARLAAGRPPGLLIGIGKRSLYLLFYALLIVASVAIVLVGRGRKRWVGSIHGFHVRQELRAGLIGLSQAHRARDFHQLPALGVVF